MMQYVVEYDENSIAWCIDLVTQARIPLEHGMLLDVQQMARPGAGFAWGPTVETQDEPH